MGNIVNKKLEDGNNNQDIASILKPLTKVKKTISSPVNKLKDTKTLENKKLTKIGNQFTQTNNKNPIKKENFSTKTKNNV